jgi:threonyl-tRNA synthetase
VPYAKEIMAKLQEEEIRVELDSRTESIGYKIREANGKFKVPVQVILGKDEVANREVNVRRFGSKDQESMKLDDFVKMIKGESKIKFYENK